MKLLFAVMAVTVVIPLLSAAQNGSEPRFVINGRVTGVADNSMVCVTEESSNQIDTLSYAVVKGGTFVLAGHVSEPNFYFVNFLAARKKIPLFIGNDKMSMSGTIEDLAGIKVTGSASNEDFVEFQTAFNSVFNRLSAVMMQLRSPEGANKQDSLYRLRSKLIDTICSAMDGFVQRKPGSYISGFGLMLINQLTDDVAAQERRLHSLSAEVRQGYYAQILQKQLDDEKIGAVGSEEIDFKQNDTAGRAVTLSSFKGKYVLVDFWASWCGPCRMENPNVVLTYKKFKDKNFTVLGVSLDKAREPWIKAIKDDGLAWTQVSDLKFWYNEVAVKYHIQEIPQNLLVDPGGKIVARNLRGADLQAKLCELLGCN